MNEAYLKAKKLGDKAVHRAILAGRYPYLPALETMVRGVNTCAVREIGISEIPLSMISGTRNADRQNAFAENFMPVLDSSSEFANKWSNLYESQLELGITDPIRVCEFMHRFYVVEGNKRVSVMKFVDAPTITADIRRILPQKSDDPDITAYYEFVDFHTVTGL